MADTATEIKPEVVFVEMTQANADANYGKLPKGKVLSVPLDVATRWVGAGIAKQTTEKARDKDRDERADKASGRAAGLDRLNRSDAGLWDTSTARDALSAPKEGMEAAQKAGIPLVNVGELRDAEGTPLAPDATIDEIMEARLHTDAIDPTTAHTQSSVAGGGSHYYGTDPSREVQLENTAPHAGAPGLPDVLGPENSTLGDAAGQADASGNVVPTKPAPTRKPSSRASGD